MNRRLELIIVGALCVAAGGAIGATIASESDRASEELGRFGARYDTLGSYRDALERAVAPNLVAFTEVKSVPHSSPGRTILIWWQALQTAAPVQRIARYFAPQAGVTLPELIEQRRTVGYTFILEKPKLIDAEISSTSARVLTVMSSVSTRGGEPTERQRPVLFRLVKAGGRWLLADNEYLEAATRLEARARRQPRGR